ATPFESTSYEPPSRALRRYDHASSGPRVAISDPWTYDVGGIERRNEEDSVRMFRRTTLVAALVLAACGGERDESSTPAGRSEAEPAQDAAAAGPDTPGGPETTGAPTAADAPGTADARATTGSSGITAGNDPTAAPPGAGEPRAGTTGPTVRRGSITGVSTQTAIRVGRQEGFDRVVFEF